MNAAKLRLLTTLFVFAVLALCHAACVARGGPPALSLGLIGKLAPEVTAAEPVGGEGPKTLREARGKVVILDFWATWCATCKQSFPRLQALVDRHPDVVVIAVSVDDPEAAKKDDLLKFAADTHAKFPILWDKDGSVWARYGHPLVLPTEFIVDRSGTVQHVREGYTPSVRDEIKALLSAQASPAGEPAADDYERFPTLTCEPQSLSDRIAKLDPAQRSTCAKTEGCMKRLATVHVCAECLKPACCKEFLACDRQAYPPDSRARADAARSMCLFDCRLGGSPFSECVSDNRCGEPPNAYRALASCADAHCSDVCPKERGGPP